MLWLGTWGDKAYTAELNGSHFCQWSVANGLHLQWLDDSRHWIEFANGPSVIVHSIDSPRANRQFPIVRNSPLNDSAVFPVVISEHHCLVSNWRDDVDAPQSSIHIFDLNLAAGGMPVHTYTVHFPSGTKVAELVFTPQGDRIAWLLQRDYIPLEARWLHRMFPAFRVARHTLESIWVSRIDGSDMHEIGFEETHPRPEVGTEIRGIYWLPGGKRLGFLFNEFWTVPAN